MPNPLPDLTSPEVHPTYRHAIKDWDTALRRLLAMAEADDQNEHLVVPDNDDVDEASEVVVPLQSPGDSEAPRTIGGFVVDDEDEEEEYTPELSNDQPFSAVDVQTTEEVESNLTNGQQLEEVPTSNELPIVPDQLSSTLKSEQDDVIADATTDVATDDGGQTDSAPYDPAVPSTNGASTEHPEHPEHTAVVEPSQSPSSSVQAVALSGDDSASNVTKARLPHDHIGLLEDRIKDDPRGDVDAWIALVNEYRRRNKLEEARKVYSRFFEIFPTAVSLIYLSCQRCSLMPSRPGRTMGGLCRDGT